MTECNNQSSAPAGEPQQPWNIIGTAVTGIEATIRLRRSPHLPLTPILDCVPERQRAVADLKSLPLATRFRSVCDDLAAAEKAVAKSAEQCRQVAEAAEAAVAVGGDVVELAYSRGVFKHELAAAVEHRDTLRDAAVKLQAALAREHKQAQEKLLIGVGGDSIGRGKQLKAEIGARIGELLDELARVQDRYDRGRHVVLPGLAELFGELPLKVDGAVGESEPSDSNRLSALSA